jgi:hypothetical protein
MSTKVEKSSAAQVLLFVQDSFSKLLKLREYPFAEIKIEK